MLIKISAEPKQPKEIICVHPTIGTVLRKAAVDDLLYVDSLRKKEGDALGFIPLHLYRAVVEKRNREKWYGAIWRIYQLLVTEDNNQCTGFCLTSFADPCKVFQIVVQQDARRFHRAALIMGYVETEAKRRGCKGVEARVATDLESNFFWRAIGYVPAFTVTSSWLNQKESQSKRPLYIYHKRLHEGLFDSLSGKESTIVKPRYGKIAKPVEMPSLWED